MSIEYPKGFTVTDKLIYEIDEVAVKAIFSDSRSVPGWVGKVDFFVDTFVDQDYIHGYRAVLEFRNDPDQARNYYRDDLFVFRHPKGYRFKWFQAPVQFFDYTATRSQGRRSEFVLWFNARCNEAQW